jgi:hypothetical protein
MRRRAGTKPPKGSTRPSTNSSSSTKTTAAKGAPLFSPFFSLFLFGSSSLPPRVQQPSSGYPKCSSSTEVRSAVARENLGQQH